MKEIKQYYLRNLIFHIIYFT